MIKKIVLASAIAIASLVSFKMGASGGALSLTAPNVAKACVPSACDMFGCSCP